MWPGVSVNRCNGGRQGAPAEGCVDIVGGEIAQRISQVPRKLDRVHEQIRESAG